MKFKGRILVLGYGSVAQCFVPILIKFLQINPKNITVVDIQNKEDLLADYISKGLLFVQQTINKNNYKEFVSKFVGADDLLIDLALNIDTIDLLTWCRQTNVYFLNSALISWSASPQSALDNPESSIFESGHIEIQNLIKSLPHNEGRTAVITHGANPGLSSHFLKKGLCDIANKVLHEAGNHQKKELAKALEEYNYAKIAYLIGVKAIHISEHDAQLINKPKIANEFVNTWSPSALIQECLDLAQVGWGTHEKTPLKKSFSHKSLSHYKILNSRALNTAMYSWVPSGNIIGMIIPHEDIFEFTSHLSLYENSKIVYCPTLAYIYLVSDAALASLQELETRNLVPQDNWRVVNNEICSGYDQLGCLLMGDFGAWWIGSTLTIEQSRALITGKNACTMQVAAGLVAGFDFICTYPNKGIKIPFEIPHEPALAAAEPFLGDFISKAVDWSPIELANSLRPYQTEPYDKSDQWQFKTFLHKTNDFNN